MQKITLQNSWLRLRPIAHRGLHNGFRKIPENSLSAFENACEKKIPIEFDVRISKDGKAIVFHDVTLFRLAKKRKIISRLTSEQLKDIFILKTDQNIPTLDEVLNLINGRVPVLIEIKRHLFPGGLEDAVIDSLSGYKGEVAVLSFNPMSVRYLHKKDPTIITGINIGKFEKIFLHAKIMNQFLKQYSSPQFISYSLNGPIPKMSIDFFRKLGLPIIAWTVKSKNDEYKARLFADNIIFEGYSP